MLTITNYKQFNNYAHVTQPKREVSFGAIDVDKEDALNLKNMPNQICACCGKQTLPESEYNSLTKKDFEGSAGHVLKKLQKYSKYMRNPEKTVFNLLKRTSNKYPDADLQELLQKRYNFHLARLEAKQLKIIKDATKQELKLSPKSRQELEKALEKVYEIIFVEAKAKAQKRSRIKKEFEKLKITCKEKREIDKILAVIETLPNSQNDVDAFMIKYAQRSNREIGQQLLRSALPSFDHIKTRKRSGIDDFSNLIVTCKKCNEQRGHENYDNWLKSNPQMSKNLKRNLQNISREIKEGRLLNFDTYPQDVSTTINNELSEGNKINLNI